MTHADAETLLFANDAFYLAFAAGDMAAMAAIWAKTAPVTCIHPGGAPVLGRAAVLEGWRQILRRPPRIECVAPTAHVGAGGGHVLCYETVEGGWLLATNVFVREDGAWRMVHHHAGPAARPPKAERPPPPRPS